MTSKNRIWLTIHVDHYINRIRYLPFAFSEQLVTQGIIISCYECKEASPKSPIKPSHLH